MRASVISSAGSCVPFAPRGRAPGGCDAEPRLRLPAVIGYYDPFSLIEYDQFSVGQEASIGFLRHAELKHGRVASARWRLEFSRGFFFARAGSI